MDKFAPGTRLTVFTILMLPLLVSLGFWQLSRAAEKRAMEADYLEQLTALAQRPAEVEPVADFSRLRLRGVYDKPTYLVDNQVHGGRAGYWVIQRFNDINGTAYLLNRGFLPAPPLRENLPEVNAPGEQITVVGMVWPFTGLLPQLAEDHWDSTTERGGWPARVQRLDVARIAADAGAQPFEIRLEAGQPSVFQAAPFAAVLNDDVHRGYAATWFGLAGVLFTGYVIFGLKQAK